MQGHLTPTNIVPSGQNDCFLLLIITPSRFTRVPLFNGSLEGIDYYLIDY